MTQEITDGTLNQSEDRTIQTKDHKYTIETTLSAGAEGRATNTYKAQSENGAEKVLKIEAIVRGTTAKEKLRRFEELKETMEKINRTASNIHYDEVYFSGIDYITVRPHLSGQTLEYIAQHAQPQEHDIWKSLLDITTQLREAHNAGLIHRDMKPSNIILDNVGVHRVIDWGVAKVIGRTTSFMTPGTLSYMAPEVFAFQATPASDIYSTGYTVFAALSGQEPGFRTLETDKHVELRNRLDEIEISQDLRDVIQQMTEPDATKRPTTTQIIALARSKIEAAKTREHSPAKTAEIQATDQYRVSKSSASDETTTSSTPDASSNPTTLQTSADTRPTLATQYSTQRPSTTEKTEPRAVKVAPRAQQKEYDWAVRCTGIFPDEYAGSLRLTAVDRENKKCMIPTKRNGQITTLSEWSEPIAPQMKEFFEYHAIDLLYSTIVEKRSDGQIQYTGQKKYFPNGMQTTVML